MLKLNRKQLDNINCGLKSLTKTFNNHVANGGYWLLYLEQGPLWYEVDEIFIDKDKTCCTFTFKQRNAGFTDYVYVFDTEYDHGFFLNFFQGKQALCNLNHKPVAVATGPIEVYCGDNSNVKFLLKSAGQHKKPEPEVPSVDEEELDDCCDGTDTKCDKFEALQGVSFLSCKHFDGIDCMIEE